MPMPFMPPMRFIIFIMPPPFIFFIMSLHLLKLLEQAVDFMHVHACTRGYAAFARGLDELRLAALLAGSCCR
jgi:hypothetical protein